MIFFLAILSKACFTFLVMLKDIIKILEKINAISAQSPYDCTLEILIGSAKRHFPLFSYEEGQSLLEAVKMGLISYSHSFGVRETLVYSEDVFPSDFNESERRKIIGISSRGFELLELATRASFELKTL